MSSTVTAAGPTMRQRMEKMASIDRIWGAGFIVTLWVVYAFVFYEIAPLVGTGGVVVAMSIGGALVLLFTTASVAAMLQQYADSLEKVYEPDILHLDEKRARDAQRR